MHGTKGRKYLLRDLRIFSRVYNVRYIDPEPRPWDLCLFIIPRNGISFQGACYNNNSTFKFRANSIRFTLEKEDKTRSVRELVNYSCLEDSNNADTRDRFIL